MGKGSETTSTTSIPGASGQERNLMDLITGSILPNYLEQAGFETTTSRVTDFNQSKQGREFDERISSYQSKYDEAISKRGRRNSAEWNQWQPIAERMADQLENAKSKRRDAEANFQPYNEMVTRKKDPPELEALKQKYGEDSSEYKTKKEEYASKAVETDKQKQDIQKQFLNNVQKFLKGDFSVSPEQRKFIADQLGPIRATVDAMYSENPEETLKNWGEFGKQVSTSGLNVMQAMNLVGEQIKQTGADMEKALTSTIETNKQLLKMGIEDATGDITKRISMQAIATGRDPSDPEYQKEIQDSVSREVSRGTLNLAQMESQGKMGIAERTGGGLEEVARTKARLAESKGQAMTRLAESESNLKKDIAVGLPPQQISVGTGFSQLDQALISQRMANAAAPMGVVNSPMGYYQSERMAQPTTTQRQSSGFMDYFSGALGLVGAGTDIYSGITSSNALRDIARGYEGGGYASTRFGPGSGWT